MAKRIIHQLIDDLDGTLIEEGQGETVQFGIDGIAYEIDLTGEHAAELRETLARYLEAGRRESTERPRRRRTTKNEQAKAA